jgi:two-component system alkaline phosphatase synthesis response regulator PhoP
MCNKIKILIVDDEPDIVEFLSFNLENEGYDVKTGNNGLEAIEIAKEFKPDLIILDVMMPVMDGIEACEELRKMQDFNNTIIIFLSARSEDYSFVAGLNAGADDYITKPVRPRVFITKIKSLLRRKSDFAINSNSVKHNFTPVNDDNKILIDKEKYIVIKGDENYLLPRKEFELLSLLYENKQKVYTREEIFAKIWGADNFISDRTIDVHIRKIRKKIGNDIITTVKGVGYKFT